MTIWQTIKENPTVLIWAVIVHVLAFIAIGVSFKSSEPNISAVKKDKVIEAVAIDERKIEEEKSQKAAVKEDTKEKEVAKGD